MTIPCFSLMKTIAAGTLLSTLTVSAYSATPSCEQHYIQSFVSSISNTAQSMKNTFSQKGFPTIVTTVNSNGRTLYRVRTGPFSNKSAAIQSQQKMKAAMRDNAVVQGNVLVRELGQCNKQNIQQVTLSSTTQCYLRKGKSDVNALQLSVKNGKVAGYHFWRPDGRDGAYGYLEGSASNNKVSGKRHYSVEGDTGSDNFSYTLNKHQLINGSEIYNNVSCDSVKDMIDVAKDVSKELRSPSPNRTSVRFRDYPATSRHKGKNHALVMTEFSNTFRTRLREAIKNQKPSFAGHYIVTGWGCGSSGCNTGAVINAKTGVATPFPVALASVYPLKPEFKSEDGQEHTYRLDSRLMVFAGNLGGSEHTDGTDIIEFYEFKNGKFIFLESRPYGRAASY